MIRISRVVPLALAAMALTASACRKKPQAAPTPVVNQDSINRENARRDSIANADRMRQDSLARERARTDSIANAERARTAALDAARAAVTAVIHFDYDRSDLTSEAQSTLDAKLPVLQANSGMTITISGHTDSRGSDEYNLALGQRRAAAAKRYLVSHGIAESRIQVRSLGEEQPVAQGEDEGAWSQNRRDEFEITAGGDNITVPQR